MATGDESPGVTRRSTESHDATERRRTEEALPESATVLQRLLESASEAVIIVDGDGRIVLFSARAEEMFGYSRDELLGQTVEALIPGRFRDDHVQHRADYVAHPRVRPMGFGPDLVGRRKDGTEFPVEIGLSFIEKDGGGLIISLITDITERRRAEEALRESEERLRILFEYAPDGYYLLDSQGTFLDGNKAAQEITGYTREELIGKKFQDTCLLSPDQLPQAVAILRKSVAGQLSGPDEFLLNRKDGARVPVEIRTFQVEIGGEPVILGIARDITELKQAEEALRESEEYLAKAQEVAQIGSWIWDLATNTVKWSDEMYRLFDMSPDEFDGKIVSVMDRIHPDDRDLLAQVTDQTLIDGKPRPLEYRVVRRDGTSIVVYAEGVTHLDESGKAVRMLGTVQDITERKRAEEALRESEHRFRRLSEAALEGIAISEAGKILDANEQLAEMLGYAVDELIGMDAMEFVATESRDLVMRNIASQYEVSYEHLAQRRDGSTFPVEVHGVSMPYDGRTARVTAMRDITERKGGEEALQNAREELEGRVERQLLRRNPYGLTFRELTVLHLVAAGKSDKGIGIGLGISPLTAQKHVSNILAKMEAASRTEAAARAVREQLLE